MTKKWAVIAWSLSFLVSASALRAHHSDAVYNQTEMVKLTGVISEHQMINPHQRSRSGGCPCEPGRDL